MSYKSIANPAISVDEAQELDRSNAQTFQSAHHNGKVGLGSKLLATLPTETEKQTLPNIPTAAEVARIPESALPSTSGNGGKVIKVNSAGSAYEAGEAGPAPLQKLDNSTSPVALFDFNGDLVDSGSAGEDLGINGGTEIYVAVPGTTTRSVYLDGSTSLIASHNAAHQITGEVTVEAVFEIYSYTNAVLVRYDGSGVDSDPDNNNLYSIYLYSGIPRYSAEYSTGTNILYQLDDYRIPLFTRCHLALVRGSDSQVQFYLNGQALGPASTGLNAPTGGAAGELQVSDAGEEFSGIVHSVRVTDSALSASTIEATAIALGLA